MKLTHARLKEVLHYCPALGLFWWKARPPGGRTNNTFNAQRAGKIAGDRTAGGYGRITVDGEPWLVHRLAWFYMTGELPPPMVDHANLRPLDNAWLNLREATPSQNQANKRGSSASGMKGAYRLRSGRFKAQVKTPAGSEHIGTYDTPEEAHEAFMARAVELHGKFARV